MLASAPMPVGEIIAVGSELLVGGCVETNSVWLGERLGRLGVEVRFKSVVGDDDADIASAVSVAVRRAEVILLTGGLGPTVDDRTRHALARITARPLRRRREAVEAMTRRLAAWGRTPTSGQLRQALIPAGAVLLPNPVGTAPGFALRWRGRLIAALPGVPKEAEEMFDVSLSGHLGGDDAGRIERRVFHTFGLIESEVDRRLAGMAAGATAVQVGIVASPLGVSVSLTACGPPDRMAPVLDRAARQVKRRLGTFLYGEGEETMEAIVGRHLVERGLTLSLAESCTGGLIAHRLTQVPGSSAYVDRGLVCYSNAAKTELLGVPERLLARYGAVSHPVAAAMARGVRLRSRTRIGLSVTGIAGPGGGSARKPVGLVFIGLDAGRTRHRAAVRMTREWRFHGDRATIKLRASQAALDLLRRWLVGLPEARR
ncbi:competence/damage-inducible protein A [Candidatus Nitrospira bockiana]